MPSVEKIEDRRQALLASRRRIDVPFGEDGDETTLRTLTRQCSMPPARCLQLQELVREAPRGDGLELGSNVGISGAYISSVFKERQEGMLYTVEGVKEIADVATKTSVVLGLVHRMTVVCSSFGEALEELPGPFSFALLDGEHVPDATVRYVKAIRRKMISGGVIVIDDCSEQTGVDRSFGEISTWECWSRRITDGRFGALWVR